MNTNATPSVAPILSSQRSVIAHGWHRLLNQVTLGWQAWRRARRLKRDESAFQRLDAAALRDLGMSFSEHASYWAEAEGLVPMTRERVRRGRRQGNR